MFFKVNTTLQKIQYILETGGKCEWPRGKMVSGTGGLYGMMYVRGSPALYDQWKLLGNPGWSFTQLKSYFKRAENPTHPEFLNKTWFDEINTGGPMNIDYYRHKPDFADELLKAAEELKYKSVLQTQTDTGFMRAPMLTQNGLRGTTSRLICFSSSKKRLEEWNKRKYRIAGTI